MSCDNAGHPCKKRDVLESWLTELKTGGRTVRLVLNVLAEFEIF